MKEGEGRSEAEVGGMGRLGGGGGEEWGGGDKLKFNVVVHPHRQGLSGTGSPERPPPLSHSS